MLEFIKEKRIVILDKVREECTKRQDGLKDWFNETDRANDISSRTEAHVQGYGEVIQYLYESPYYTDAAVIAWSDEKVADPWLIAVAKANGYTLVTKEKRKGALNQNKPASKPKIPNVGFDLDVEVINLFDMMRELKFKLA